MPKPLTAATIDRIAADHVMTDDPLNPSWHTCRSLACGYLTMTEDACDAARLIAELRALAEAAERVMDGFDEGFFVRDTSYDDDPQWAVRAAPHIRDLADLYHRVRRVLGRN